MRSDPIIDTLYGYWANGVNQAQGTQNLNAAASSILYAHSFHVNQAKTLSNIHIWIGKNGTLNIGDIQVDIYSNLDSTSSSTPNASLVSATNSVAISASGWFDFAISLALTAGINYWVVVRNLNGTPTSNFPTMRWVTGQSFVNASGNVLTYTKETWNGSTWGNTLIGNIIPATRFDFNDSTYMGLPVESIAVDATNIVYSGRKVGNVFTTPNWAKLRVMGVYVHTAKLGAPTGNIQAQIYQGTNLIATTATTVTPALIPTTTECYPLYFSSPIVLTANTSYRVVLSETTQSDASTNAYKMPFYTVENNATSRTLMPYQATVKQTYFDGSSWTDTIGVFAPMAILLDPDQPYDATPYPSVSDVRSGTSFGDSTLTGTLDLPSTANVKTGITYDGASKTGTYDGSDRWSDPLIANVRSSIAYKANSTSNNRTGTAVIPGAPDVRSGTSTDATVGSLIVPSVDDVRSGTSVDATTGNLVVPTTAQVKTGITFGSSSGLTGTYDGSDRWSDPLIANVRSSIAYKANSTTNNRTGTLDLPVIADVRSGTTYDGASKTGTLDLPAITDVKTGVTYDGASKTGTYTGSDRWSDPLIANVRSGISYKANSTTNNRTGTANIPGAPDVRSGVATDATTGTMIAAVAVTTKHGVTADNGVGSYRGYDLFDVLADTQIAYGVQANVDGSVVFGIYTGSDRWSDPGASNVRSAITYKADSTVDNRTGTAAIPSQDDVRSGVAVDATTGDLSVPTAGQVKHGVTFESSGGQTGTYRGADIWSDPLLANVRSGTVYLADGVSQTGTLASGASVDPGVGNVKAGTDYEINGVDKTGTYNLYAVTADAVDVVDACKQGLASFLQNQISGLTVETEWPYANKKLAMPCITIFENKPKRTPSMIEQISKTDPDTNGQVVVNEVVGWYDFSIQLDLWTVDKKQRTQYLSAIKALFASQATDSSGNNHPDGLSLQLTNYFNEWVRYEIDDHMVVDDEAAAERRERREKITVLVNCREIRQRTYYAMSTIQVLNQADSATAELTDDANLTDTFDVT